MLRRLLYGAMGQPECRRPARTQFSTHTGASHRTPRTGKPIGSASPGKPIHDNIRRDRRLPMNLAQPRTDRYYSREEFRRWCEAQTRGRYERVDGWIVAMAPERGAHLRVKGAIYKALDRAVTAAGVPCQAL